MNRGELEAKLWELCGTEREIIWNCGAPVGEVIKLGIRRQELMDEILDEFLRIHTVVNWPAEEALAEKRAWAAAWKKAAKKKRAEAENWGQMFRQRYEKILEARAECTRLFEERAQQVTWKAATELDNVLRGLEAERDYQAEAADWQMNRAIKAEGERDEARAECTRLADQLDGSPWAGVLEQRDEARAECTELYLCWRRAVKVLSEQIRLSLSLYEFLADVDWCRAELGES